NDVGDHLNQLHRPELEKGTGAGLGEAGLILGTLGHRELSAIDAHQAQAKGKAARGLRVCKGPTQQPEKVAQDAHAQVATAIAEASTGRGRLLQFTPQAQGAQQSVTDGTQRAARETPGDEQVDQEEVIELAFPLRSEEHTSELQSPD